MPPSALDTLAESLAGTFPGCDDAPLALTVLRQLANGEPVAKSMLPVGAERALARWPNVDYDEAGRVVAFSGLSDPTGVRGLEPEPLWVTFPPMATTSTADSVGSFCCHVHFLTTSAAAEQWLSQRPEDAVLDLDDAYALGRRAMRCCTG